MNGKNSLTKYLIGWSAASGIYASGWTVAAFVRFGSFYKDFPTYDLKFLSLTSDLGYLYVAHDPPLGVSRKATPCFLN